MRQSHKTTLVCKSFSDCFFSSFMNESVTCESEGIRDDKRRREKKEKIVDEERRIKSGLVINLASSLTRNRFEREHN